MIFLSGEVSGNRPKICASEKIVVSYNWHGITLFHGPLNVHFMTEICIDYARCSTDRQDLTARQEALAANREGYSMVVSKLDRLEQSVPDAREIAEALQTRGVNWRREPASTSRQTRWEKCSSM